MGTERGVRRFYIGQKIAVNVIEMLGKLDGRLHARAGFNLRRRKTVGDVRQLTDSLRSLLDDGPVAQRTIRETRSKRRDAAIGGSLSVEL